MNRLPPFCRLPCVATFHGSASVWTLVALFTLIFLSQGLLLKAAPERNTVKLLHELNFPEYRLSKFTFQNGVDVIKKAWVRQHPEMPFPVIVASPDKHDPPLLISMDLRNVSALDALTYLAESYGLVVRHALDVVMLQPEVEIDGEMWRAGLHDVPPRAAARLGLTPGEHGDNKVNEHLKKTLEELGITFPGEFEVQWLGRTNQIYLRNTPAEATRLKTLIMLLEAGYTVTKPDAKDSQGKKTGGKEKKEGKQGKANKVK